MRFDPIVYKVSHENRGESELLSSDQTILLLDEDGREDKEKIVAQVISLDIRGEYGLFLNAREESQKQEISWTGNLFKVLVKEEKVIISELSEEKDDSYEIEKSEWIEALRSWQEDYLKNLGFMEFSSKALNHMFAVLLLTFDQMSENECEPQMLTEAIKKSSSRFGVNQSVIYRDCKKVTGSYDIEDFFLWTRSFLKDLLNGKIRNDNKYKHICSKYEDISKAISMYFEIY